MTGDSHPWNGSHVLVVGEEVNTSNKPIDLVISALYFPRGNLKSDFFCAHGINRFGQPGGQFNMERRESLNRTINRWRNSCIGGSEFNSSSELASFTICT